MAHVAPSRIPVIDLFAGPGGLGEGFSCLRTPTGEPCFEIRLSVEKDPAAHRTLELRSLIRSFPGRFPDAYYDYLRGDIERDALFSHAELREHALKAKEEAWNLTLGPDSHTQVMRRVKNALGNANVWILIGGPPCQAYSLVGRSRMLADGVKKFEKDSRHFLYREYLRILADHAPPIFIMENVKGLLSATHGGKSMFDQILADLSSPSANGPKYRVVPLGGTENLFGPDPRDYIVRSELYGVPQARHRVILCGIREDVLGVPMPLVGETSASVQDALAGLRRLRSRLSREEDSHGSWLKALAQSRAKVDRSGRRNAEEIVAIMDSAIIEAASLTDSGQAFYATAEATPQALAPSAERLRAWYHDPSLDGIASHTTRSHMREDLQRYFFAAAYAKFNKQSPKLRDFPASLLPAHENAHNRDHVIPFEDRFRVQLADRPSTTIVSHISKDGHYFIHPDPAQCRSLTVREAARLQTFPDNYHFEGNRTQQFVQIGNAVPPYLAAKIASSIYVLATSTAGEMKEAALKTVVA